MENINQHCTCKALCSRCRKPFELDYINTKSNGKPYKTCKPCRDAFNTPRDPNTIKQHVKLTDFKYGELIFCKCCRLMKPPTDFKVNKLNNLSMKCQDCLDKHKLYRDLAKAKELEKLIDVPKILKHNENGAVFIIDPNNIMGLKP